MTFLHFKEHPYFNKEFSEKTKCAHGSTFTQIKWIVGSYFLRQISCREKKMLDRNSEKSWELGVRMPADEGIY